MKYEHVFKRSTKEQSRLAHIELGRDQRGMFALATTLSLVVIFAFVALGVEVGKWYIVRAELSKTVDAASLLGAKNISNPHLDTFFNVAEGEGLGKLVEAVGEANFSPGVFGADTPQVAMVGSVVDGKVKVEASANVLNHAARTLGAYEGTTHYNTTHVASTGAAQQREAEVMLVLDKSGSMSGSPIDDLKTAATAFLNYFEDTQDNDEFGLVTFASGIDEESGYDVTYHRQTDFVSDMTDAIDLMAASGGTNAEDALDRADGSGGFSDQTIVPGDQRKQQFLIFFSDGNPTAFRGTFTREGTDYDAVAYAADWDITLMKPDKQFEWLGSVKQFKTGDGLPTGSTVCKSGSPLTGYPTTKWAVLSDPDYGVNNYNGILGTSDPIHCDINWNNMKTYVEAITKQMAIDHAQEMKDNGIKIYTIGLGGVDQDFLGQISSGQAFQYYTPDSSELEELFQQIASNIKLRLVQS